MPWFSSSSGRTDLFLTMRQAELASHPGQCDDDVLFLSRLPSVARQLAALDPDAVREDLGEYGAWDDDELADHEQNLQRLLWLAAGDIVEEARTSC